MDGRLVFATALAAASLACSGPPTTERAQADGALAAARAAGASTYAAEELAAAESALSNYDAAVAQRDYKTAFRLAVEARDGGFAAAKHAAEQQAAARSQAERLVTEADALLRTANARLAGQTGPRFTTAQAARVRTALKSATASVQEARSLLEAKDYPKVQAALSPLIASLRKELEPAAATPGRRGQ